MLSIWTRLKFCRQVKGYDFIVYYNMANSIDLEEEGRMLMLSIWTCFNLLPDNKGLDWSKLKQIADNFFKCIQNGK